MRTWRIPAQVITCDFCCFSQYALSDMHSPCSHRSVVRWGRNMRCPLFVSSRSGIVFNPNDGAVTDHSQSAKAETRILSPGFMWRTPATESRYSFYRIGWLNPERKRTTEVLFQPWVGFEPTTSWSTVQHITTELSPPSILVLFYHCHTLIYYLNHKIHITRIFCYPLYYLKKYDIFCAASVHFGKENIIAYVHLRKEVLNDVAVETGPDFLKRGKDEVGVHQRSLKQPAYQSVHQGKL